MIENNSIHNLDINAKDELKEKLDPGIIVLIPDKQFDYSFWESVANSGFDVFIVETEKELEQLLETRPIETLYIRTVDKSQYISLCDRLKKTYRFDSIIYFISIKELLITKSQFHDQLKILKDNFNLMNRLHESENTSLIEHTTNVVQFVESICDRLLIPDFQKLKVIAATYLHSFSLLLINNDSSYQEENEIIKLSSQFLRKVNYSSEICNLLDLMYKDLYAVDTSTNEFFLSNIITASDFYCHSKFNQSKLTPEEFKQLNEFIKSKIGSLLLPAIAQELIEVLYNSITIAHLKSHSCFVLIFNERGEDRLMLKECLENLGFEVKVTSSTETFVDCYRSNKPDILVIETEGTVLEVSDFVNKVEDLNINFDETTTYLITNNESLFELTGLLQKGIEDIFCIENDLDPFLIKIIRTRNRIEEQRQKKVKMLEQMGTFGALSNMSLIDLLQTMNVSGKTCMISITAQCHQLTIYVHNGTIIYASNDEITGAKAIFSALEWTDGIWNIDQISLSDFPEPNINKSINSILLEGCQYMDESQKINTKTEFSIEESFNFLEE